MLKIKMEKRIDFTTGKIVSPLIRFALPILFALFLQAMYGAVDLLIVGKFAKSADISAVSTGSQIMMTITNLISSLAMGLTVLLAEKIGQKRPEEGGRIVGSGIMLFLLLGVIMSVAIVILAPQLASVMNAPKEAFDYTTSYIRICGLGAIVIISYNLIG
ncbi:MAG: oligosaccharide flippase family protein, partial [Lachnospiraceae bacterium]|nr:oligosaccharide flippase family protein [Lachnospiraceae bacterium]